MLRNRLRFRIKLLAGAWLLFNTLAGAQTPTPVRANGLCNSGLTPKNPLPDGCLTSSLVNPINPEEGGPIVDGNWDLAQPIPSSPYTQPAPNPCVFTAIYTPVPVSVPDYGWYNPNDHVSQWIEPQGGSVGGTPPGWYIYRTHFPIPPAESGYPLYELTIAGQFMSDDYVAAIYAENPAGDEAGCREVAAFTNTADEGAWQAFQIASTVFPETHGYLYFVVYNIPIGNNPTGLRVEFTRPYFLPY